jgi:hypothetical protein
VERNAGLKKLPADKSLFCDKRKGGGPSVDHRLFYTLETPLRVEPLKGYKKLKIDPHGLEK